MLFSSQIIVCKVYSHFNNCCIKFANYVDYSDFPVLDTIEKNNLILPPIYKVRERRKSMDEGKMKLTVLIGVCGVYIPHIKVMEEY